MSDEQGENRAEPTVKELEAAIMLMASACFAKLEKGKKAQKVIIELKEEKRKLQESVTALIKDNKAMKEKIQSLENGAPTKEELCGTCDGTGSLDEHGQPACKGNEVTYCPSCTDKSEPQGSEDTAQAIIRQGEAG